MSKRRRSSVAAWARGRHERPTSPRKPVLLQDRVGDAGRWPVMGCHGLPSHVWRTSRPRVRCALAASRARRAVGEARSGSRRPAPWTGRRVSQTGDCALDGELPTKPLACFSLWHTSQFTLPTVPLWCGGVRLPRQRPTRPVVPPARVRRSVHPAVGRDRLDLELPPPVCGTLSSSPQDRGLLTGAPPGDRPQPGVPPINATCSGSPPGHDQHPGGASDDAKSGESLR